MIFSGKSLLHNRSELPIHLTCLTEHMNNYKLNLLKTRCGLACPYVTYHCDVIDLWYTSDKYIHAHYRWSI